MPLRVTSDEIQRSYFSSSFIVRNSRMCFKLESRGGVGYPPNFSFDKTNTFRIVEIKMAQRLVARKSI